MCKLAFKSFHTRRFGVYVDSLMGVFKLIHIEDPAADSLWFTGHEGHTAYRNLKRVYSTNRLLFDRIVYKVLSGECILEDALLSEGVLYYDTDY